ncbi:MAG TPA: methyltransferase domain-containing protein, partial [Usitatibacter sp.]|nr:methyltransferase domain-containing protein [Usitatibacter sp.]
AALVIPRKRGETRAEERLAAHYRVERRLADRVRAADGPEARRRICATMYDELFREVPDHPRLLAKKALATERTHDLEYDLAQLSPYLRDGCTFLEIGAGDCALSSRVAAGAKQVYAVEICDQRRGPLPGNVALVISDGRSIAVPEGSVDVAFSDQLMEHLHPDDAAVQLANIHRALKPGGAYVCITPNKLYGPSDISAYFDDEARGFHLREYTLREVRRIFAEAGFARIHAYIGARGWFLRMPCALLEAMEGALEWLPARLRRRIADTHVMRALLGLRVAAIKS